MYCVNENEGANPHFAFFFSNFQFFLLSFLYDTYGHFHQSFLGNYLILDYEIFDNFVFSLKVLQPLMATTGGM